MPFFNLGGGGGDGGLPVLTGSGAPGASLGVDGQIYIDSLNERLYGPKTAGAWGSGYGFGSGDYTELVNVPAEFNPAAHAHTIADVTGLQAELDQLVTSADVASQVAGIVDNAPETLNTLAELSAALNNDSDFAANVTASLAGKAAASHSHAITDVTGLQAELDAKAAASSLATVATTGSYNDLSGLPTLGTAAATDASDYATAAQGNLADSSLQPGDLATVATSGLYNDLSGIPTEFLPAAHTHTSSDVTDFDAAAAAAAPIQSINSLTGDVTIANGTGITLTESGQTLTLAAVAQGGDVDGGTFGAAGNVLTEGGDNLAAETGDTLTIEGGSATAGDSIQLLRSSVAGATPSSLLAGELAINTEDGLLYWQRANGTIASADIDLTLATVATSGSYNDLTGVPTSFTPSAHTHNVADVSGLQLALDEKAAASSLATVATSGSYNDLTGVPTSFNPASHTHIISDVTGLQVELDAKAATASLATVATSGSYSDLSGIPTEFSPSAHTHTASEITDFGTAAAAAAPLQSINSLTGTLTIAGSGGTTVTESGSTITVASTAPPTVLADLSDVSTATPSTGQVLKWTGSAWAPQTDATNGTGGGGGGGGYGSLLLFG